MVGDGTIRIEYTGVSCENVWNHCVYTSSSTPIARARANGTRRWDAMGCIHSFIHSFIRLSSTREETDARDAPTVKIDIDRIERIERVSLSLSRVFIDRFERRIHSFIHSFIPLRTNEGTNEPRDALERDALERDARDATIDASVRIARDERCARLERTTHRTHRIAHACIHFKRPTGDDRGELHAMHARMNGRDRVTDEFFV